MRRSVCLLYILAICLLAAPFARAQDTPPICAQDEFTALFNLAVDYQLRFSEPLADLEALMTFSQQYASDRLAAIATLPHCAEALDIGALLVQLGGDYAASAALQLAGTPTDANPFLRSPAAMQLQSRLADMIGRDRTDAPAPSQRQLPACAQEELDRYETAAADLSGLLAEGTAPDSYESLAAALENRLNFRAQRLADLPWCAEAIGLAQTMNAAVTDSASGLSFAFVGVSQAQNPFAALLEAGMAQIGNIQMAPASPAAPPTTTVAAPPVMQSSLAPCSLAQLDATRQAIASAYPATFESLEGVPRAQAHLDFRQTVLLRLPICREAFSASWWLDEWLGAPTDTAKSRLDRALANLSKDDAPSAAGSQPCSAANLRFIAVYIAPAFHSLMRQAFALTDKDQTAALTAASVDFRALLRGHLPRCDEAARLAKQMRAIAADFPVMLAMESAGMSAIDIPYTLAMPGALAQLADDLREFNATLGIGESRTWFVNVNGYANVRSCGSTSCGVVAVVARGDPLDVLDDSGEWYEIRLPSGGTGFIAAFLASDTPTN